MPVRHAGRRSWSQRLVALGGALLTVVLVATAAAAFAVNRRLGSIRQVDLAWVISPRTGGGTNYLIVGSDSREGADPNSPDFGSMGDEGVVGGQRSDTIMVLRAGPDGRLALLSIPRDLYVEIAGSGRRGRINGAYSQGPATLVATVSRSVGVPVHHYLEIDFQGFKRLVDALGGVEICFDRPARDGNTGLLITVPGCFVLDGTTALAYARSRHFETQGDDGRWREDPSSDLGRIERQQDFLQRTLAKAVDEVGTDPFVARAVVDALVANVTLDTGTTGDDLLRLALRVRRAQGAGGIESHTYPATGRVIGGASVLVPDRDAAAELVKTFGG